MFLPLRPDATRYKAIDPAPIYFVIDHAQREKKERRNLVRKA
jgi:hypothetical protein